jgi:hypothetical protein
MLSVRAISTLHTLCCYPTLMYRSLGASSLGPEKPSLKAPRRQGRLRLPAVHRRARCQARGRAHVERVPAKAGLARARARRVGAVPPLAARAPRAPRLQPAPQVRRVRRLQRGRRAALHQAVHCARARDRRLEGRLWDARRRSLYAAPCASQQAETCRCQGNPRLGRGYRIGLAIGLAIGSHTPRNGASAVTPRGGAPHPGTWRRA